MKCARCASEIPTQSQFCMRCGTPVAVTQPGGPPTLASSVAVAQLGPNKAKIAVLAAALLLLAIALFFGLRALRPSGKLVQSSETGAAIGPLTERSGRVANTGPLTDRVEAPTPPAPVDVVDYLKFLKEVERQRVTLHRQQVSEALKQSTALTAGNLLGEMSENPEERHRQDYANFQQALAQMLQQWQTLSQTFLSRPAPASCATLQSKYYDVLGKTSEAVAAVGNSMSQAMSGNPGAALDTLTGMQGSGMGSASKAVTDACSAADAELAAICQKFNIHKDFDIKDDLGGANLLAR
jgi:hypothetical protein